jgi:hypothetical protein
MQWRAACRLTVAALVVSAVFVLTALTVSAVASVPACPAVPDAIVPPETPSDTDRVRDEVRELRREQAMSCDAMRAAGVETRDAAADLAATTAATTAAVTTQGEAVVAAVHALDLATSASAGSANDDPAYVRLSTADTETQTAYAGLREALWLVAGLMVAQLAAPLLRRMLAP